MKLYYGNSNCSLDAPARGVQISYRGKIEITDKTSDTFAISASNNIILIFPVGEGTVTDIFDYTGELKILSVIVANEQGEREPCTIQRVMDYSELLNSNSEDMAVVSEDMSAGYVSGQRVARTSLKQKIIPNLHTSSYRLTLFTKDGSEYTGEFHIHLEGGGKAMSGREHTRESQDLFYKKAGKDKLITTGKPLVQKRVKARTSRGATTRRRTSSRGGTSGGY